MTDQKDKGPSPEDKFFGDGAHLEASPHDERDAGDEEAREITDTSAHSAETRLNQHAARQTVIRRTVLALIGALVGGVATSAYFVMHPLTISAESSEKKCPPCPPEASPSEPEKSLAAGTTKTLEDATEEAGDVPQASAISHPEPATVTDDNDNEKSDDKTNAVAPPVCPTPVACPEPVVCHEPVACPTPIVCPAPVICAPQKECLPEKVCAPIPAEKICPPIAKCPPPEIIKRIVRVKVREVVEKVVEKRVPVVQEVVRDPTLKRQLRSAYERIQQLEEQNGDLRMKLARERAHRPQKR